MDRNNHNIWIEKYRPKTIDEFITTNELRELFKSFVSNNYIPHLLLHNSTPGVGKTSLAKILMKSLDCDYKYINASDNNGIDFIRDEIKPFVMSIGNKDLKVIVLDEFDFTTPNFQAALRNLMETASQSNRFILTCNYISKIIEPIISRCQVFKIEPPSLKEVASYTENILKNENIEYDRKDLGKLILSNYPDIRTIIGSIQKYSYSGKLNIEQENDNEYKTVKEVLLNNLKEPEDDSFLNIRQSLLDIGIKSYDELYKDLYDNINEYGNNKTGDIIETIADYSYKSSFVIDKEICFMACIVSILKLLKQTDKTYLMD